MRISFNSKILNLFGVISLSLISGCHKQPQNGSDPYESFNRKVYTVNSVFDNLFLRPATVIYTTLTPGFVQKGVHNAYNNLWQPTTIANDLLQGKGVFAMHDTARFFVNTTVGILGLFDVAQHMGLAPHHEDFGLTLATWGATDSNYLMVPAFGPNTFRDGFSIPFNMATSPITYVKPTRTSHELTAGEFIDTRAQYLAADPMIQQSFDPYVFVRDAYLQNRSKQIADNTISYRAFQKNQAQEFVSDTPSTNAVSVQEPTGGSAPSPVVK